MQYLPFSAVVVLFGLIFTYQNRRLDKIEQHSVNKEVCHQAQDTIKAEIGGLKSTLCAKLNGLEGKIDVLINGKK